mmetsp:Transcript_46416/g.123310  ORF Transcript_46416/g.123310 Transcript_46416/m.123310 type:complete len:239 (+) Transcript_46416:1354-2070(+)
MCARTTSRWCRRKAFERDRTPQPEPLVTNALHTVANRTDISAQRPRGDETPDPSQTLLIAAPGHQLAHQPRHLRLRSHHCECHIFKPIIFGVNFEMVHTSLEACCHTCRHVTPTVPSWWRFHSKRFIPIDLHIDEPRPCLMQALMVLVSSICFGSKKHSHLHFISFLPPAPQVWHIDGKVAHGCGSHGQMKHVFHVFNRSERIHCSKAADCAQSLHATRIWTQLPVGWWMTARLTWRG